MKSSKFNESAKKALNCVIILAENFGHTYVGSEHILLALAEDKDSRAAEILASCGVDSEKIKNAIVDYSGCGSKTKLTHTDCTPRFLKTLEDAAKISESYKDSEIKTEHILAAICEQEHSVATEILHKLGVDLEKIVSQGKEKMTEDTINFDFNDGTLRVFLIGEIDYVNAKGLREETDKKIREFSPSCVVLDFSQVNFMDSAGIGFVIGRAQLLEEYGGKVLIEKPSKSIRHLLKLSGIGRMKNVKFADK